MNITKWYDQCSATAASILSYSAVCFEWAKVADVNRRYRQTPTTIS